MNDMTHQIKKLYSNVNSTIQDFERIKELINSIKDDNTFNVMLKSKLKKYSNTCLADFLIFSDLIYQLLDTCNTDEMELILQAFSEADDEEF